MIEMEKSRQICDTLRNKQTKLGVGLDLGSKKVSWFSDLGSQMYSGVFSVKGHMVVGQDALEVGGGDHELGFRFLDVNMKYILYNLVEKSEQ